ncbi:hypothetical protein [Anaerotignum sp.]
MYIMLGEAAIAMRGLGVAGKVIGGGGSSSSSSSYNSSSSEMILQGGLAGAVGRQFNQNAISNITGKSDSIASNIARSVYNSSIQNGGGFSTNVISTVAKGDIACTGSIKGDDAVQAFQSYMGIDRANSQKEINTASVEKSSEFVMNSVFDNQSTSTNSDSSFEGMQTSIEQVLAEYQQNIGMEPFDSGTEVSDGVSPSLSYHQTLPPESDGISMEKGDYFIPSVDSSA